MIAIAGLGILVLPFILTFIFARWDQATRNPRTQPPEWFLDWIAVPLFFAGLAVFIAGMAIWLWESFP